MTQAILSAVVSAFIAGIFALIGKALDAKLKSVSVTTANASIIRTSASTYQHATLVTRTDSTQPTSSLSMGKVLRDIGILQLVANIIAFVIGFTLGMLGLVDSLIPVLLIAGTLILIIGFLWSGATVNKAIRWRHLLCVAFGVIVVTLLTNSLILQTPITMPTIAFACFQTLIAMGIGGAIANTIK